MRRLMALAGALAILLSFGSPAYAQVNDDPAADGTTGLFVVPRATTLQSGTWSLGGSYGGVAREEGDSQITSLGFMGAYGLSDRLEIFVNFQPYVKIDRRFTSEANLWKMNRVTIDTQPLVFVDIPLCCVEINEHPFAVGPEHSGFGDVNVGFKYKMVGGADDYDGLAVQGWFKAPTANDGDGIGTGRISLGAKLIGSLEAGELIGFNAYGGYLWHDDPDLDQQLPVPLIRYVLGEPQIALPSTFRFFVSPEVLYGVGFHIPSRGTLQAIVEWYGSATTENMTSAYTGGDDQSILQFGGRAAFDNGLALGFAANYSMLIDVRDPEWQMGQADAIDDELRRWGFLATASYSTSRREPVFFAGTAPIDLPILNRPPTLTCRAERTGIRAGESVRLFATGDDPDGDPLTISWSASAGTLSATSGAEVTWDSSGVPAGAGPVRARATDGFGGEADCELRIAVEAPPPPGQATTLNFVCSEFPSGNSRIDNRCKAVLDDVALQLRQNPSATATVTGHSDSAGSASVNDRMAMERADNAKAYLVATHGIDAARITASSAGSTMPMADNSTRAGQATNRRIEIVVTIPPR